MSINTETIKLYWQHMSHYKPSFFTMLIAVPIAMLINYTLLPYFLSQTVGVFATGDHEALGRFLWLAAGAAVVGTGCNLLGFQAAINHESAVRRDLTESTLARLLAKDQHFFSNQKIGALTSKYIDFINAHVGLQDLFIMHTLSFALGVGSGIAILFFNAPLLGAIMLGLIIALLVQVRLSMKWRTPYRVARKKLVGEVNGAAADSIANSLTVKTFANETHEQSTLSALTQKYLKVYRQDFRRMSTEGSARILLMSVMQIISIAVIAHLLFTGQIALGIAIFTVAYLQRIASQLFSLGDMMNGYDKLFLQAAPMTEILISDTTIVDKKHAKPLTLRSGVVELQHVNYAYSERADVNVLDDLSLRIPQGQKVGIVGMSGAGKTTLTKLLLRFDDVTSGAITIDAQDIRNITQESLRRAIAYVPQEPMLFHRSLRENIAYGKLDATDAEIKAAAEKAYALKFINALPEGLDTIVGERGVKLSGGQRQRIAIARAILKDAPILILDEATSALDSESEQLIQSALEKLMKGRTSIVIAHRLSTIAKLDRIIVLDKGKIAEDGTHTELLQHNGIYAKLWNHQSGGFIEE